MLRRTPGVLVCLVLTLSAAVATMGAQSAGPFILDGPAPAAAFDVNAAGRMVGSIAMPDGNARAVLWRNADADAIDLLLLPGTNWSRAFAVNARGQIVGQIQDRSMVPVAVYAGYWESDADSPVALASGTLAVAINSAGPGRRKHARRNHRARSPLGRCDRRAARPRDIRRRLEQCI